MKIDVFGSSSEGNSYLVSDGATHLLIDCGLSISELKFKTDFFNPMPNACLVSHGHGDHSKSMKDLLRLGIPCYMSKETYATGECEMHSSCVEIMEHLERFTIGTFEVMPLKMKHDIYCLGFYIHSRTLKESLFFATDTCYIPYSLPPLDYIMVEANYDEDILNQRILSGAIDQCVKHRLTQSHMDIANTILWLKKQDLTKTKRIYLLHLSNGSSNAADFKRRVIEVTGVPTTIAGG